MVAVAEERSKIALIDLMRLLFQYEASAAHILYKHWEIFDISIFQYLMCMDIKDPENKVIHNYHLVSLKMIGNIYQTQTGLDFIMETEPSSSVIQFCEYSMTSCNPKTVFTAAVVMFNHVLTFKKAFSHINQFLENYLKSVVENIGAMTDPEALNAVVLSEIRIVYKNADILAKVIEMKDKFIRVHSDVKAKTQDNNVKFAIEDLMMLLGEE
jgi:hypothetical protein